MISIKQLSQTFEDGLNAILGNSEIKFKIWAHAGQYKLGFRDGNSVTYFINGNLKTSTSANDANDLVMGVNGLSLEFAIPIERPRTNAGQSAEELQKIKEGQYPFVQEIFNVIDTYFQKAQSIPFTDENGTEFSLSYQAGASLSGTVDILPVIGQCITASVYIEIYYIEGGISSKSVKITFDNSVIPFQAVRYGRSPMTETDIYAGKLVSKNLVTSSAFAIDADFPANEANGDKATGACLDYLLKGEPNVAHFVNVDFGSKNELYFMTINTVQTSAQGIAIAGVSASLMEVVDNAVAINVPGSFQVGRFAVGNSTAAEITFTPSVDCLAYLSGKAVKLNGGEAVTMAYQNNAIDYDEEEDGYFVYLITNTAIGVTNSSVPFEVVSEVVNG